LEKLGITSFWRPISLDRGVQLYEVTDKGLKPLVNQAFVMITDLTHGKSKKYLDG
jgi:hypothetical protein